MSRPDTKADTKPFNLRLPAEMVEAVDARAKKRGISRNEWYERMTQWVLEHAPPDWSEG